VHFFWHENWNRIYIIRDSESKASCPRGLERLIPPIRLILFGTKTHSWLVRRLVCSLLVLARCTKMQLHHSSVFVAFSIHGATPFLREESYEDIRHPHLPHISYCSHASSAVLQCYPVRQTKLLIRNIPWNDCKWNMSCVLAMILKYEWSSPK
jgi:hypothetical protein